ncbi:MAG: APC family permease [Flavobacteriales bacterium]|jgi:amino acid transporter|nr:APC family permease [Flavobacteriales bacterium]MBK6550267.1 APC family permease [Flavobacteriales bacterium]MBK6881569.1 APC family permease [Flavobacteriales bacterium]MBK7102886.1 APC family permease [Flavobacteriales bacterium]MBK7113510.1 APC family permease [Flavobacteriales bacterium]
MAHPTKKLGTLSATAICGNDITSSCLYVSAITIGYAGPWAFVALAMVAGLLFLFRRIYGEVVGALPLNGGAYNVLLNTTNKTNASIAACLTILSYMATAVISASEAMHYLHALLAATPVISATLLVLTLFLLLNIAGISESAVVAVVIFVIHLSTMAILILAGGVYLLIHGLSTAALNFNAPLPGGYGFGTALFFGFSVAMLGVSGFESSANFVEEQEKGVFPKTLRNMWLAVTAINPLMALVAIAVLPLATIGENKEALLTFMGYEVGGQWLGTVISVDAVLVLCGAVLTSFVGVSGLMKRMTLDRILPQFLLKENARGSSPRILILFYALCVSVLLITNGKIGAMAGVYTISFLTVMAYFALGNFLLKIKRSRLPRPESAKPFVVALALLFVIIALYGNIKLQSDLLVVFLQYFVPAIVIIQILLKRNIILEYLVVVVTSFLQSVNDLARFTRLGLSRTLRSLTQQEFVYFTKGDDIASLNRVMMYVQENEITKRLKVVSVKKPGEHVPKELINDVKVLDRAYPDIAIEFVEIEGLFGPEIVQRLSTTWNIPANFMFIGSPGDKFPYRVAELGGVRLII